MTKATVLVTGFGPFGIHTKNISWESVQLLKQYDFEEIDLVVQEVQVDYQYVDQNLHELWKLSKPTLVVHVGVGKEGNVRIETVANKSGYVKKDICGLEPNDGRACCAASPETIFTKIDVEQICNAVNDDCKRCHVEASKDAGRYLCEYIYYKSLSIDCSKALFVHVPPEDMPYSKQEISECLKYIIIHSLQSAIKLCNRSDEQTSNLVATNHLV